MAFDYIWLTDKLKGEYKEALDEIPEELVKRFHKKNEKLQKKGKERMSPEEYMEQLRKENIRAKKGDYIVAAIALLVVILVALTSTFTDTLIFIAVLAVAEIPTMAMIRLGHKGTKEREKLIAECERRGITILDYVKEREETE